MRKVNKQLNRLIFFFGKYLQNNLNDKNENESLCNIFNKGWMKQKMNSLMKMNLKIRLNLFSKKRNKPRT